jgi:hypothetical protein
MIKTADRVLQSLRDDDEFRKLLALHFVRAEEAKRLMRDAGFGVTGTDILETTKEILLFNR